MIHFIFLQGVWFQGRLNPHNSLLHKDLQHFYQHVLSTLKVVLKKIEPPYSLYLSSCRAVFINTFCPITLNLLYDRQKSKPGSPKGFLIENIKKISHYYCMEIIVQTEEHRQNTENPHKKQRKSVP